MLKVFLSYAKEDKARVLSYFNKLKESGFAPWMDVEKLLPGQNWEAEVDKAFNEANVILLFLSEKSVSKRGYVQREANEAIENLRYKQPTDIYVIPLLLEHCELPTQMSKRLQYEDLQAPGAWDRVLLSLQLASKQQQIVQISGVVHDQFTVFDEELTEEWVARPGHNISINYPRFTSVYQPKVADELTFLFRGRAAKVLIDCRNKPWDQSPDFYPEPVDDDSKFVASNGRWDSYGVVHANQNLVSLVYNIGWYGAGAAHPNSYFETYNFALVDSKVLPIELHDLFLDSTAGVSKISELCVKNLQRQYWERMDEEPDQDIRKWILEGAGPEAKNFSSFSISSDHLTFLFAPYQVGPYASGSWSVDVSFFDLLDVLRKPGIHTLAKA